MHARTICTAQKNLEACIFLYFGLALIVCYMYLAFLSCLCWPRPGHDTR